MPPRVLVVDDSAFVRLTVARALERSGIEVAGFARDGEEAVDRNLELEPDVVVLDLQMPRMNGAEAIRRIQATRPVPVLVFASMTPDGAALAVEALAEGAAEVLPKPTGGQLTLDLAARVWGLVAAQRPPRARSGRERGGGRARVVAIASSTGGPALVEAIVGALPADFPAPVVVAQHMPALFTRTFAERLDRISDVRVLEGYDGATVGSGDVCILPGGAISTLQTHDNESARLAKDFLVRTEAGTTLGGARPNATALFLSALGATGGELAAVVLTGMGADGADAVPALVAAGGHVIAQSPEEAVIPSMPNAAIAAGAQTVSTASRIPSHLFPLVGLRPEGRP